MREIVKINIYSVIIVKKFGRLGLLALVKMLALGYISQNVSNSEQKCNKQKM